MKLTNDPEENIKIVIQEARKVYADYPVVAELAATQAILESRLYGKPSGLALKGNNLFGIKDTAKTDEIEMLTTECTGQKCYKVTAKFAKFDSLSASFLYHRNLMQTGIKKNRNLYVNVFSAKTFEGAAKVVSEGDGTNKYATDPKYFKKLVDTWTTYVKGK